MSRKSLPAVRPLPVGQILYVAGSTTPVFLRARRDDLDLRLVEVTADDATNQVRSLPRLSAVWVDEGAGPNGVPLVAALKTLEPELPIAWSGRGPKEPAFPKPGPDRILLGHSGWQSVEDSLGELLHAQSYHSGIVEQLCLASTAAMAEGFKLGVTVPETFFKATRTTLASVCAAVEFGGRGVEASLLVSAEAKPLREMLRLAVPGAVASLTALHDLAGEIANHIVGRLKVAFDPDGVVFERQSPVVLRGNEANLRALRGRPSLVARMVDRELELYAQLFLKGKLPDKGRPPSIGPGPGELKFL